MLIVCKENADISKIREPWYKLGTHISGSMYEVLLIWLEFFYECIVSLIFLSTIFFWPSVMLNKDPRKIGLQSLTSPGNYDSWSPNFLGN